MNRYLIACNGNSKKSMALYRLNLRLSQEIFTLISCFEVALRNSIDQQCILLFGDNWLLKSIVAGGIFDNDSCRITAANIQEAVRKMNGAHSHSKLVSGFGFGFWRYFFATNNFNATGRCLLNVFPARPHSSILRQFNNKFVFNQLARINILRNRIAHHEPICFQPGFPVKDTMYVRETYQTISQLFKWMGIDKCSLLYGLDHILITCNKIDAL